MAIEQLYATGFSRREVRGLVDRRYIHRIHRGIYAVGPASPTRRGRLLAAQLACGETAFLTHRSGAGIRGLRAINPWEIHVSVVGGSDRHRSGIVVHRLNASPHAAEVKPDGALRVASVPLLLIQLAASESRSELDRLIELAARRSLLRLDEVEETLGRHPRARGAARLRTALAAYVPRPFDKSGLERAVAAAIAADPWMPPPLRNQHRVIGGIRWELDFHWEDLGVALEVDGDRFHRTPADRERDRIKDAKLMAEGIVPLRITDTRWELDPQGALADLRSVLARVRGVGAASARVR